MTERPNYASGHGTYQVSAKRFARSPWFDSYVTDQAVLGVYSGRFYALSNGDDPIAAYWHLRRGAVLFDVPERPIEVCGPAALDYLQRLFCRDIAGLRVGRATYAIACNHRGGLLMDGVLMRLGEDRYWYVLADGDFLGWMDAISADFDVTVRDPNSWVLQVQGPRSFEMLGPLLDGPPPDPFRYFDVAPCRIAGEPFLISRSGWTGEMGFELYTQNPDIDGARVYAHILNAGAAAGVISSSLESMGIRRIEAGIRDNGTDMDPGMTPYEAGLGQFVDLDAKAFIGRDALRAANHASAFYGVLCVEGTPIGRHEIVAGNVTSGRLTTAAWSPHFERVIGYARFDEPGEHAGERIKLRARDGAHYEAEVVELPFYDREKRIPRGLSPA